MIVVIGIMLLMLCSCNEAEQGAENDSKPNDPNVSKGNTKQSSTGWDTRIPEWKPRLARIEKLKKSLVLEYDEILEETVYYHPYYISEFQEINHFGILCATQGKYNIFVTGYSFLTSSASPDYISIDSIEIKTDNNYYCLDNSNLQNSSAKKSGKYWYHTTETGIEPWMEDMLADIATSGKVKVRYQGEGIHPNERKMTSEEQNSIYTMIELNGLMVSLVMDDFEAHMDPDVVKRVHDLVDQQ